MYFCLAILSPLLTISQSCGILPKLIFQNKGQNMALSNMVSTVSLVPNTPIVLIHRIPGVPSKTGIYLQPDQEVCQGDGSYEPGHLIEIDNRRFIVPVSLISNP
jgi:hypothetical protein